MERLHWLHRRNPLSERERDRDSDFPYIQLIHSQSSSSPLWACSPYNATVVTLQGTSEEVCLHKDAWSHLFYSVLALVYVRLCHECYSARLLWILPGACWSSHLRCDGSFVLTFRRPWGCGWYLWPMFSCWSPRHTATWVTPPPTEWLEHVSLGAHPVDLGGAIIHLNCPAYDRPSPGAPSDYPTEVCSTSLFQLLRVKWSQTA